MVHCGYEPSATLGDCARRGDTWQNIAFNFAPKPAPRSEGATVNPFNGVTAGNGHRPAGSPDHNRQRPVNDRQGSADFFRAREMLLGLDDLKMAPMSLAASKVLPFEAPALSVLPAPVSSEECIRRAQENLLLLQKPDGHWQGELIADATLCGDYIIYMHWLGKVDETLQAKCASHIRRRQLPDGGWNIYEDGPSDINASVKAYFALKLAGHAPTQPWMQEARACILRLGGIPRMNTYAKLYLALLGQFPWKYLPTVPVEMVFFPKWFFFNLHELSSWSRAMLMPLAILNHYKPTRQLPAELQLHELYPVGSEQSDLSVPWRWPRLSWPNFFLICDWLLKWLHLIPWKPWRGAALARAENWMCERMGDGSDGLAAIFPAMLNSIIALKTLRYPADHPLLVKAQRDFAGLFVDDPQDFRIQPCLSPVWDTSINLIALIESGVPAEDPRIRRAIAWLASKEVRTPGDWCVRNPGRRAERLGVRVQQHPLPGHRRHDDGPHRLAATETRIPGKQRGKTHGPRLAALLSMSRRRLGRVRQGRDAALARRRPVRRSQRHSRSPPAAILRPRARALGYLGCPQTRCAGRPRVHARHPGRRRLLVRTLGRQLHLRHLAGPAGPAQHGKTCASPGCSVRATG